MADIIAERRQVTVVYCDLVDSTGLQEREGVERYYDVQAAFFRVCLDLAERVETERVRYTGDGCAFSFGRLTAHENDAERAIRFAFLLTEATAALRPTGLPIAVRVAVATGEALVQVSPVTQTGPYHQDPMMVGPVLHLAARLMGLAQPNEVVVADLTRRLASGWFEYRDRGEHRLKGFSAPRRVWRVVGESNVESRFDALRSADPVPLVGRMTERNVLTAAWERAKSGTGQSITVQGEPGIGKSRLARWLAEEVVEPYAQRLYLYSNPQYDDRGVSSALEPLRHYLASASGFETDDSESDKDEKLESLLAGTVENLESTKDALRSLLAISDQDMWGGADPEMLRIRRLEALVEHITGLTAAGPLVLIFEDAQWADDASLDFLSRLSEAVSKLPILLVITAREDADSFLRFAEENRRRLRRLSLSVLPPRTSMQLVSHVLGPQFRATPVAEHIVKRADGNPLFVEDLCLEVQEDGGARVMEANDVSNPTPERVPQVLWESLMSRLDRLPNQKRIAQVASVIGREFSHQLLSDLINRPGNSLQPELDALVDSRILLRSSADSDRFSFRHALVRDTAYFSVLESERGAMHWDVASALQDGTRQTTDAAPDALAEHMTLSALWTNDSETQRNRYVSAAKAWCNAAKSSANRSEVQEALARLDRARNMLQHANTDGTSTRFGDDVELEVWTEQAYIESIYQGWSSHLVQDALGNAFEVCERLRNPDGIFDLFMISGGYHITCGKIERGGQVGRRCLEMARAQRPRNPRHLVIGARSLSGAHFLTGQHDKALEVIDEALEIHDKNIDCIRSQDQRIVTDHKVTLLVYRQLVLLSLGRIDEALQAARECVAQAEHLDHTHSLAFANTIYASVRYHRQDSDALAAAEHSLVYAERQRFATFIGASRMMAGCVLVREGVAHKDSRRVERGLNELQRGAEGHDGIEAATYQPFVMGLATAARLHIGRPAEGEALMGQALEVIKQTGETWYRPEVRRLRGECMALQAQKGDTGFAYNAQREFEAALEEATGQNAGFWRLRSAQSLARLLLTKGERNQAVDTLAPALEAFPHTHHQADIREGFALLNSLTD